MTRLSKEELKEALEALENPDKWVESSEGDLRGVQISDLPEGYFTVIDIIQALRDELTAREQEIAELKEKLKEAEETIEFVLDPPSVNISPKKSYTIRAEVIDKGKAKPHIALDEES